MKTAAGVDCHLDSHTIVFIDTAGQLRAQLTVPATLDGYGEAFAAAAQFEDVVWGLEGTGCYGRAFADYLRVQRAAVYEVPGAFTKRHRRHSSRRGKSDPIDARAIAEAVLRERDRLTPFEPIDEQDALRVQYDRRDRLVRQRTEAVNRLRSVALRLALGALPKDLTTKGSLVAVERLTKGLRGRDWTTDALLDDVDEAIDDIRRFKERIIQLERRLRPFVERLAPELLRMRGVSTVVAAGLIGHAGNLRTCRNAAALAMRAGTAPVPCSSGRGSAVRLNIGGDRQLNRCLYVIATMQLRTPAHPGRVYYDRKRGEGKTNRAALRALKRQLTTVVHYALQKANARLSTTPYGAIAA